MNPHFRIATVLLVCMVASGERRSIIAFAQPRSVESDGAVVPVRVIDSVTRDRTLVLTADGRPPAAGSIVWLFDRTQPLAQAVVQDFGDDRTHARIEWTAPLPDEPGAAPAPLIGRTGVALAPDAARRVLPDLHETAWLWFKIAGAADSQRTVWLDAGRRHGLSVGAGLLAEHDGWPVARLRVEWLDDGRALAAVTRLVANFELVAGDACRLWPMPRELQTGRVSARILRLRETETETEVWIPTASIALARPGDRWVVLRDDEYVGLTIVREVREHYLIATANPAVCRMTPQVGDIVVRRPVEDVSSGRAGFRMFRVDDDYALVTAGVADGLIEDTRLLLYRDGRPVARLRVTVPQEDHAGATLEAVLPTVPESAPAAASAASSAPGDVPSFLIQQWDEVYVDAPGRSVPTPTRRVGRISEITAAAGVGFVAWSRGGESASPGTILSVRVASRDVAVIVLAADESGAAITMPDGRWRPWLPSGAEVRLPP
ncbi:MAG: hypothetical protein L6R00_03000 [Phycisphaerae bacterium]|nr:hypothetical protein [Phycisphaerae bacterium]